MKAPQSEREVSLRKGLEGLDVKAQALVASEIIEGIKIRESIAGLTADLDCSLGREIAQKAIPDIRETIEALEARSVSLDFVSPISHLVELTEVAPISSRHLEVQFADEATPV